MVVSWDDLEMVAAGLAGVAHNGQFRNDGSPYIIHPERVAGMIREINGLTEVTRRQMVAAAYLHDVSEKDCAHVVPNYIIEFIFGIGVAALVDQLTNRSHPPEMPRCDRKLVDRSRLSGVSREAKLVKLCDRIDNLRDMRGFSNEFKDMYKEESKYLLYALQNGDPKVGHKDLEKQLEELCVLG